jgi:polyisoprenoid-binding protein YceI
MKNGMKLFGFLAIMLVCGGCKPASQQATPPLTGVNGGLNATDDGEVIVDVEEDSDEPATTRPSGDQQLATVVNALAEIGPRNARAGFVGTKKDGSHKGGFQEFAGRIQLSPAAQTIAAIEMEIQTDSLWSDNDRLTNHLKSPDFFNVRDHPVARFASTAVTAGSDSTYTVTGNLTLLGETREIQFPISASVQNGALLLASDFKIDRTQFGMTYGEGQIYPEVEISVHVGTPTAAE